MADGTRDLKQLQTRLTALEQELNDAKRGQKDANKAVSDIQSKISQVKQNMEKLKQKDIIVSEHALLRYFERVLGYDLEEIKAGILGGKTHDLIDQFNSGKFPQTMPPPSNGQAGESFRLVVKNRVVTTIET